MQLLRCFHLIFVIVYERFGFSSFHSEAYSVLSQFQPTKCDRTRIPQRYLIREEEEQTL